MSNDSLKVHCPQCASKLSIKEELRHKKIACPKCQYKFKLSFSTGSDDLSSIVQGNLETRSISQSPWKTDDSIVEANVQSESKSKSKSFSGSSSQSSSRSNSGSMSSSDPNRTDWGAEHRTHIRQFRRKYSGLSRAQFYQLVRSRYRPLSDRDEILQSTGIFLVILSILTALLPLFDLKFADFATAGTLPAFLSISTAVIGMLMVVVAQRKNPIMALGLGLGMLLMFIVAYIGIYDYFGENNPFRIAERNHARLEGVDEENVEREEDQKKQGPVIVDGANQMADAQQQISDAESGVVTEMTIGKERHGAGNRPNIGVAEIIRRQNPDNDLPQPVNPRDVEIPEDFDPADDRFAPDHFSTPVEKENSGVEENGDLPKAKTTPENTASNQTNFEFVLRNRIRKMTTETLRNGVPQTDDFEEQFSMDIAGTITTIGSARMTGNPVLGYEYLERGGALITEIAPCDTVSRFANSIFSPGGEKLCGMVCHFRDKQLVGIQALYEMKGRDTLASGAWAGKPLPVGEAGNTIDSGGRDIYGFAIFKNDKQRIVGLGVVFKKK